MNIFSLLKHGLGDIQIVFASIIVVLTTASTYQYVVSKLHREIAYSMLFTIGLLALSIAVCLFITNSRGKQRVIKVLAKIAIIYLREQPKVRVGVNKDDSKLRTRGNEEKVFDDSIEMPTDGRARTVLEVEDAVVSIYLGRSCSRGDVDEKVVRAHWNKEARHLVEKDNSVKVIVQHGENSSHDTYWWIAPDANSVPSSRRKSAGTM